MFPVSARFLDVITGTHRAIVRCTLFTDRRLGLDPVSAGGGLDLPVEGGNVQLTSTADVKATLDLTVPGDYFAEVQPYSGEIFVERGVDFGDGTVELVPLGYYRIDTVKQSPAPFGPVQITGSDRNAAIIQNRVLFPYQVPDGTSHRVIFERLVNGRVTPASAINTAGYAALATIAVPITWTGYDPDRITVDGGQSVTDSTYDFLAKLASAQGCTLRFVEDGSLVVDLIDRDPDATPIYAIAPGLTGNLVSASRSVDRTGVYNIVTAYGSDVANPTGYQISYNGDPNSPLRWNGPFGPAPRYFSSPLLDTPDAAAQAAASILSRTTGLPETIGLFTVPNPALRPLDMISAKLDGLPAKHLIDTLKIPFTGNAPVEVDTKSANSDVAPDSPVTPAPLPDQGFTQAQRNQEKCFEITSTAENSTIQWWSAYDYVQNIGDGRGFTCGIVGFTSADGDLEDMIKNLFLVAEPTSPLAAFVTGLHTCTLAGEGDPGATNAANTNLGPSFTSAWKTAAAGDATFRKAQRDYREAHYWAPAYAAAIADGLSVLGLSLYYDTYVNHGPGVASSGDGSFEDIRSQMTGSAPSAGGNETTWLTQFLSHRSAVLTTWGDNPSNGRIHMFTDLVATGNFALTTPFSWSVYGDAFQITTEPDPFVEGVASGAFTSVGQALNIGPADGLNHFNIGVAFAPGNPFGSAAVHHDYSMSEIAGGLSLPGHYELLPNGLVRYTVPLDGGRTSTNTKYPRVEHRGLNPDGTHQAFNKGTLAYIKCRSSVPKLPPSKPEVVLCQFHDANNDVAMIHVQNGLVRAKIKGNYVATLATGWDRSLTDMMIEVTATGTVNFYWSNLVTPAYVDHSWEGGFTGWYGKIGGYAQSWARSAGDTSSTRGSPATGPTDNLSDSPIIVETDPTHFEMWQTGWAKPARLSTGGTGTGGGTGGSTNPPTPTDDGVQTAVTLGWGPVIDGDEFEYVGPLSSKWGAYDGPGHGGNGLRRPSAFAVANGVLTCTGDNVSGGTTGGAEFRRDQKYWRIEWRVRTYSINPSGSGNRYHPVLILWPTSDRWPQDGEYDFYECDCDTGKFEQYLHIPGNDGSAQEYTTKTLDIQNWHNVAFEWSKSGVTTWIDGVQQSKFTGSYIQAPGAMHPTIQLDNFYGHGMEPAKFEAKWMRIYASPA